MSTDLKNLIYSLAKEGELYEKKEDNTVRCYSCAHRCLIHEGFSGICKIRFNENGSLKVPSEYIAGMNCDPIEKKPFYHVLPGESAMSFGMLGCDFHCDFCQNWVTSQALRDSQAGSLVRKITAKDFVDLAIRYGAKVVTSTYNEPLITSEWGCDVFREAKKHNLYTSYVSNGFATPEVLEYLRPYTDMFNVDLKSFQKKNYQQLGGNLEAVLDTISNLNKMGFWLELVTLLVPDMNDSEEEIRDMAKFIASVDSAIPWHITAYHEDYHRLGSRNTSIKDLLSAAEIGKEEGLQFVYIGNVAGAAPEWENTICPFCDTLLIERRGFRVGENRISGDKCPSCNKTIPGIWN